MKNKTKQPSSENYHQEIKNWEEEDVMQLANHFHKIDTAKGQFERTSEFVMALKDVEKFEKLRAVIEEMRIYLALDTKDKEKQTFFPVLRIKDDDNVLHFFKLYAVDLRSIDLTKSAEVPELFKNMICKNWDAIDMHLIDDLFMAKQQQVNGFETTARVLHYQIDKKIVDSIIKKLPEIKGITFYSGIDMNKFSDKKQISFTPVLGFQHDILTADDVPFGLKNIVEFSKRETFIEYSRPCPPTC